MKDFIKIRRLLKVIYLEARDRALSSLNEEPTLVVCIRFFRYEIITFNEVSSKPQAFSLAIKSLWEMQLKEALDRSIIAVKTL